MDRHIFQRFAELGSSTIPVKEFKLDGATSKAWTTQDGRQRKRYYVPQRDAKEHAGASRLPRLPPAELDSAVLNQMGAILRSSGLVSEVLLRAQALDPDRDSGNPGQTTVSRHVVCMKRSGIQVTDATH